MKLATSLISFNHLTMAYGYWKAGNADQEAIFKLTIKSNPLPYNYVITCGLEELINEIKNFKFDIAYLSDLIDLKNDNNNPFFNSQFINYLQQLKFTGDIDAVPEGMLVFAAEPILLIKAPLIQCLLLETIISNILNFNALVATKVSHLLLATNRKVMFNDKQDIETQIRANIYIDESSLNNSVRSSRSAYIGGCKATSNTFATRLLNIPLKSAMSHNWVKSFSSEFEAFKFFADTMQNQTILGLNTYNIQYGLQNAIMIGTELRRRRYDLFAVQLNFNNIKLTKKVRKILDKEGFKNTKIFVNGSFNKIITSKLLTQKSIVDGWDINTKTITETKSIGMNYELIAIQNNDFMPTEKTNIPTIQQIRRFYKNQKFSHDIIYAPQQGIKTSKNMHKYEHKDLLLPIFRAGELIYQIPILPTIRNNSMKEVIQFANSKCKNYPVKIESQ